MRRFAPWLLVGVLILGAGGEMPVPRSFGEWLGLLVVAGLALLLWRSASGRDPDDVRGGSTTR